MNAVAERNRQHSTNRSIAAAADARQFATPCDDAPYPAQIEAHAEYITRPDAALTNTIIECACSDAEFSGQVYGLINRDIEHESDAWAACQLSDLVMRLRMASENIAAEDMA